MMRFVVLALGFFCLGLKADSINTHMFRFSDTLETIHVEDALGVNSELVRDHRWMLLRASFDYVRQPLTAVNASGSTQIFPFVDHLYTFFLGAGFLMHPRLLMGLSMPLHHVDLSTASSGENKWTLGDVETHLKFRVSPDDSLINLAIMPYVFFPTGNKDYLVSDDGVGYGAKILVDAPISIMNVYLNLGYTYASNAQYLTADRSKRVEYAAGIFVPFWSENKLGLNAEITGSVTFPGYEDDQNPFSIRTALRAKLKSLIAFVGLGWESIGEATFDDFVGFAGVKLPFGQAPTVATPVVAPPLQPSPSPTPNIVLEQIKKKLSVVRTIHFTTAKDSLRPESFEVLDEAAQMLVPFMDQIQTLTIHGHTDSVGKADYNKDLSQRRANTVKNYLAKKGIDFNKIIAIGHGEDDLMVDPEVSDEDRQANRRVEFVVQEIVIQTIERQVKQ